MTRKIVKSTAPPSGILTPAGPSRGLPYRGFTLVVTLTLMILLTVIAVGLLTLSSISLRSSAQGMPMATARANARVALMLALGDLQKAAGPDQRVTARADILNESIANPHLTGVWKSWQISATTPPSPADYQKTERDKKFQCWLVSAADPAASCQIDFAQQPLSSPVVLMGKGTMGETAADTSSVSAGKVPLVTAGGSAAGALAWAVIDEGVKARINTHYADDADTTAMKTAQLGAGERPGVEFLPGLSGLERKFFEKKAAESATIDKGFTRLNFALAGESLAPGVRAALMPLTHDVTTHSLGLFTDTARGGFKQDFHLLTNTTSLPDEYSRPDSGVNLKGVYESRLEMTANTVPSDPKWASLLAFARLYRDNVQSDTGGVPYIKAHTPAGWTAATTSTAAPPVTTINRTPPPGVVLQPTIAKVQMLFSLIGRDMYRYGKANNDPAAITEPPTIPAAAQVVAGSHKIGRAFDRAQFQYLMHLLYTPVITLHNPYNVALELNNLKVSFASVPFAMQIFRSNARLGINNLALTTDLVPVTTMWAGYNATAPPKTFELILFPDAASIPAKPTVRLLPGEVKVFSPNLDPARTWLYEVSNCGAWGINATFWNISGYLNSMKAIPGWPGHGIGFDFDQLGGQKELPDVMSEGHVGANLALAYDDEIYIKFAPLSPAGSGNKFIIQMTSGSPATVVNAIEIDYEKPSGLQDTVTQTPGQVWRYPKTGTVRGSTMVDHQSIGIGSMQNVSPFALLSVQAKTTSGARDADEVDGRYATKPWCFAHANIGGSSQKVVSEQAANFSHEFNLQLLEQGARANPDDLVNVEMGSARGNFIAGQTSFNGTKFGIQYEIPLAPLQTLASLNGANPAGSSGYLPRFAQPIGNSWAHPLIDPAVIVRANANPNHNSGGYFLDHSFLLNLALYDGFYFSGLADQASPFGSSAKTTAALASGFSRGTALDDPRMVFWPPAGQPAGDFAAEVAKPTAYATVAAWQLLEGAFNINSTSVPAWKAMLTSIHDSQALVSQLNKATNTTALTPLTTSAKGTARISRFRLPAADSAATGTNPKDGYWLGQRDYTDAEMQTLAENIVMQVKARGPFLSLAEFVNRRLGPASDAKAQRGALQQAIDDSNLNTKIAQDVAVNAGFQIPAVALGDVKKYNYANPAAGAGPSYQGAPGFLTQADLLNVLGNAATPRSDTFTIRGYGEALDQHGTIIAHATCEAVVQRFPEWVDPADPVGTAPAALTRPANQIFGRRFLITSFRWLNPSEV